MDERIGRALRRGHLIDITTTGRRTGTRHRVELVFHNFGGRIYISGMPGRRDWYANLVAKPEFTFHLKRPIRADLPAVARPITDEAERREVFALIAQVWRGQSVERMVRYSPLVEVTFDEAVLEPTMREDRIPA
ncbi:MAG: nitroreductase/quinone reductase family protein [Candidatus Limnocylindria bacterium]